MHPVWTEWWLRPESNAARVGEHSAVVWKRLYRNPSSASRCNVGVFAGPPNVLVWPKPTSSSRTSRTLGAPFGGAGNAMTSACESPYVLPMRPLKRGSGRGRMSCVLRFAAFVLRLVGAMPDLLRYTALLRCSALVVNGGLIGQGENGSNES